MFEVQFLSCAERLRSESSLPLALRDSFPLPRVSQFCVKKRINLRTPATSAEISWVKGSSRLSPQNTIFEENKYFLPAITPSNEKNSGKPECSRVLRASHKNKFFTDVKVRSRGKNSQGAFDFGLETNLMEIGENSGRKREKTSLQSDAQHQQRSIRKNGSHTHSKLLKPEVSLSQSSETGPGLGLCLDCKHFSQCSGCSVSEGVESPEILDDAKAFFKALSVNNFKYSSGNLFHGWRCRAKLAVGKTAQAGAKSTPSRLQIDSRSHDPVIGLYREGSHEISDIVPDCQAHHPKLNEAAQLVRECMIRLGIIPFDEKTGSGELRYMQLVLTTNHDTSIPAALRYGEGGLVQLSLVWNARDEKSPGSDKLVALSKELWKRGGSKASSRVLHSIWANFQTTRGNVIFGDRWRHLIGPQELWQKFAGVDICLFPGNFGQANYTAFDQLLLSLQRSVPHNSSAVELYAGIGVIGLSLLKSGKCSSLSCVEINKTCEASFQKSVQRLIQGSSPDVAKKVKWRCADAEESPLSSLLGNDVIIVDPPRRGLSPALLSSLRELGMRRKEREKGEKEEGKEEDKERKIDSRVTNKVEKRPWKLREQNDHSLSSNLKMGREIGWQGEEAAGKDVEVSSDIKIPHTFIYVSCGWEAFKRDCLELTRGNVWRLERAESFLFFPGTNSLETLGVFKCGKTDKTNSAKKKKK